MEPTTKYMPEKLIEAFGGEENIMSLPRFNIDNSYFGILRDYPDFIRHESVTDPIMIGIDQYRRTFIILKIKFVQSEKTINITTVLFQRYTDVAYWTSASNPQGIYHIMGDGGLGLEHFETIKKFLEEKCMSNVTNYYTWETGNYVLAENIEEINTPDPKSI